VPAIHRPIVVRRRLRPVRPPLDREEARVRDPAVADQLVADPRHPGFRQARARVQRQVEDVVRDPFRQFRPPVHRRDGERIDAAQPAEQVEKKLVRRQPRPALRLGEDFHLPHPYALGVARRRGAEGTGHAAVKGLVRDPGEGHVLVLDLDRARRLELRGVGDRHGLVAVVGGSKLVPARLLRRNFALQKL
jgi:hypothetical protein